MVRWIAYALVAIGALGLIAFQTGIGANLPVISSLNFAWAGWVALLAVGVVMLVFTRQTGD